GRSGAWGSVARWRAGVGGRWEKPTHLRLASATQAGSWPRRQSALKAVRLRDKLRDEKPCIYRGELRHSFRSVPLNAMMRATSPLESRIRLSSALRIIDGLIFVQKDGFDAGRLKTHPAISPIPLP